MTALLNRPSPKPDSGHTPATGPAVGRVRGSANLSVGAATAAAVLLCSLSVHGVIEGWSWLVPLILTVVVPLAATAGARRLALPLPLIPVTGVAVLVCTLSWLFASSVSLLGFLPGPGTLARANALLFEARTVVITEVTPVQALPGILFLACAGIGLVAVLADTLAATLRMPATSGLGLFAVVMIPAVLKPESVGGWYFLLAAGGYLLVLAAGARREQLGPAPGAGTPRGWLARCTAVSAAALVLALALPPVLPGFTTGAFPQGARFNFWSGTTGLNPIVTLGNDLRRPQSAGRITYATSSAEPVYLRSTTLEDFSGTRWAPILRSEERRDGVAAMSRGPGSTGEPEGTPVVTRISSDTYASPWLLAPYYPVGVTGADGRWSWDPKTMTVLGDAETTPAGQDYQVLSIASEPTPEQLAASGQVAEGTVDPVFTDLPANLPSEVGEASRDAVGNAATPYAKAMAIQSYLRGPQFSYSLEAPVDGGYDGNGLDVLSEFLERKAGYCVHFAAAMAVMARQEGIPSRMALGYAPGRSTGAADEGTGPNGEALRGFEVDSTDAHAWPELYFDGVGWVRFEPTPSRGSVPDYAQQPRPATGAQLRDDDDPRLPQAQPVLPAAPRETPPAPETVLEPADTASSAWLWTALGVAAAAAAAATPWALRRHRTQRRRRAATGPVPSSWPAWDEVADLGLDYGHPGRTADTPRTYARRLAEEGSFSPAARQALNRICRLYEEEAYAVPASSSAAVSSGPVDQAAPGPERSVRSGGTRAPDWSDVEAVRAELNRSAGVGARLHAWLLPPSLAMRFRHG